MREVVVYDACVLYPSTLRDVLIRAAIAGLVQARWSEQILDEVFRNLAADRPDLDSARLARTRRLMNQAIRDVNVTGYEHRVDSLALPDADDRHVLAAAIESRAALIVTRNLKDFPAEALAPHDVQARHPDAFLLGLHWQRPTALPRIVADIVADRRAGATVDDVLKALSTDAPSAAVAIGDALAGGGSAPTRR
ncbi:PIN domain-containing protein [Myceligenerans halotolerans]